MPVLNNERSYDHRMDKKNCELHLPIFKMFLVRGVFSLNAIALGVTRLCEEIILTIPVYH